MALPVGALAFHTAVPHVLALRASLKIGSRLLCFASATLLHLAKGLRLLYSSVVLQAAAGNLFGEVKHYALVSSRLAQTVEHLGLLRRPRCWVVAVCQKADATLLRPLPHEGARPHENARRLEVAVDRRIHRA